jgi:hypothetical protein
VAEKLAAGRFQNVQITGVIDVIAQGAFGVSHPMGPGENQWIHGPTVIGRAENANEEGRQRLPEFSPDVSLRPT